MSICPTHCLLPRSLAPKEGIELYRCTNDDERLPVHSPTCAPMDSARSRSVPRCLAAAWQQDSYETAAYPLVDEGPATLPGRSLPASREPSTNVDGDVPRLFWGAGPPVASMEPSTNVDGDVALVVREARPLLASMEPSTNVDGDEG